MVVFTGAFITQIDRNSDNLLNLEEFVEFYNVFITEKLKAEFEAERKRLEALLSADEKARKERMYAMLDKSIFAPRRQEAESKDYFESSEVISLIKQL